MSIFVEALDMGISRRVGSADCGAIASFRRLLEIPAVSGGWNLWLLAVD